MTKDEFQSYLTAFRLPDQKHITVLRDLAEAHPYSSTIQMLYTKTLHTSKSIYYEDQLQSAALVASDRRKLYQLIMSPPLETAVEKNAEAELIVAEQSIDSASERANDAVDQGILIEAINSSIQQEISESEPENFEDIAKELVEETKEKNVSDNQEGSKENPSHQSFNDWLNAGSSESEKIEPELIKIAEQLASTQEREKKQFFSVTKMAAKSLIDEGEIVTETLAKIYADQGNYVKAIQAYRTLCLKIPEKSVLFAARIKELEKLKN